MSNLLGKAQMVLDTRFNFWGGKNYNFSRLKIRGPLHPIQCNLASWKSKAFKTRNDILIIKYIAFVAKSDYHLIGIDQLANTKYRRKSNIKYNR